MLTIMHHNKVLSKLHYENASKAKECKSCFIERRFGNSLNLFGFHMFYDHLRPTYRHDPCKYVRVELAIL